MTRTQGEAVAILPVLLGMAVVVVVANRWGQALLDDGVELRIFAPPLIGRFRLGPPGGLVPLVPALAVGALLVLRLPRLCRELAWSRVLILSAAAAAAFAVSVALIDGASGLTRPMELPGHYLQDVGLVDGPGELLRTFTDRINDYGTHIRSHPPGLLLLLWGMAQVGLGGSGWAATLVILGGALAVPAVAVITRELAGESAARGALPFLVLAPVVVYVASTADALFAGVGAWALAAFVVATGRHDRRGDGLALAGGALFGLTVLLSYGSVLIGLLPLAVAAGRRRARPLVLMVVGGAVVLALAAGAGFWWLDGLLTTRGEYLDSVASVRPYGYFLLANLAGLALLLGPATVAGLGRFLARPTRHLLALVLGPALAMVAIADLSGMSKGEVERIWLPFAVFLLPAGALVADDSDAVGRRRWLGLQVAATVAIPLAVRTNW
ncbi:MAG: hypothetical protein ABIP36_02010 [Acidimicrobiales bacterium]